MGEAILEIRDLWIEYRLRKMTVPAVRGVGFTVRRGEIYGLVGESGCGKSTVAYGAMGWLDRRAAAPRGQVLLAGRDMLKLKAAELRAAWGREAAMVCQDPLSSLNPALTIGSQLREVLRLKRNFSARPARDEALKLLTDVNIPDPEKVLDRYPHQLSGGMKQRVSIAAALAAQPALLIMDEPTTALDVTTAAQVLDLIPPLQAKYNLGVLYISHDLGVIARICDRVGVMYAGRLLEEGPVRDIYRRPRHPYTIGLLDCLPQSGRNQGRRLSGLPGRLEPGPPDPCPFQPRCRFQDSPGCRASLTRQAAELEKSLALPASPEAPEHRTACDASGWLEAVPPPPVALAGPVEAGEDEFILDVQDLAAQYQVAQGLWGGRRTLRAVDGVSFQIARGRTLAVVGESGCGKSSLARTLIGFNPLTGGRILFNGQLLAPAFSHRPKAVTSQLTMVFQNPDSTLNPKHTVGYALTRPLELNSGLKAADRAGAAAGYLELVGLGADYARRYPGELSGGQKQRVAIARALASHPRLVICDEPTSALDVSVQAAIVNLLLDLQARLGVSYLFISHDLAVVRHVSDRLAVMYSGRFCEIGPAEEIFAAPAHPYTRALLAAVPRPDPENSGEPVRLAGSPPSPLELPAGCRFHTRCRESLGEPCRTRPPQPRSLRDGHLVYCHRY
ncbi:ABC transporter ATP-binding protein [Deltaproteobacteria bacterium]|nr:ABC transporter ATP-binding protein [Deltaproteobacteria bacterium]